MDSEADERCLRENLYCYPPLHTRRTLDQLYFLTLENTSNRDRDQVVYRETRKGWGFDTHSTRVVMVDQLWLWILDDNTIITSFPRRWGRNVSDSSDVHTSVRKRLEELQEGKIQTIFDLALIIIDCCSRVFFDPSKPPDERPEVMDIFRSTVGRAIKDTTIASGYFWRNNVTRELKFLPSGTIEAVNKMYLDIDPEGNIYASRKMWLKTFKLCRKYTINKCTLCVIFESSLAINGEPKNETDHIRTLIKLIQEQQQQQVTAEDKRYPAVWSENISYVPEYTIQGANDLLELIQNRNAEIKDLEATIQGTSLQLQNLLSLKQHQASIIAGRAALEEKKENLRQGRAIMAFTLVTILFVCKSATSGTSVDN